MDRGVSPRSADERATGGRPAAITTDEIDEAFVPRPVEGIAAVAVGEEVVLVRGWRTATALNRTAALLWGCFHDGDALGAVVADLAGAGGPDRDALGREALALARRVGAVGLLEGVVAPPGSGPRLELLPDVAVGDDGPDADLVDLDGRPVALRDLRGEEVVLVAWNPDCGFCAALAPDLARADGALAAAGVRLVLVASGGPAANRAVADAAGLRAPVLLRPDDVDPFDGYGTPTAYHLGVDGRLVAPPAFGAEQVRRLVATRTGSDAAVDPGAIRYLIDAGGTCGPVVGPAPSGPWRPSRVYRIGDVHVGLRPASDATAAVLDALALGPPVDDARAGHSYSVALTTTAPTPRAAPRPLHLLVRGGEVLVRSRDRARVLRALLWHLEEDLGRSDPPEGCARTRATAVVAGGRALLLPPGLHLLAGLQPRLARHGIAPADVPHPWVDLDTAELVVAPPALPHDPAALTGGDPPPPSPGEAAPVGPGRYPLAGWGVLLPHDGRLLPLSPAEAAAATLSLTVDDVDPVARLGALGALFTRVAGFGLWYDTEAELVDGVVAALG